MKKYKIILVLFFLAVNTSCRPEELDRPACKSLILNIGTENINTDLRITDVDTEEIYEDLYDMVVVVDNFSDSVLKISPNDDLKVFFLKDTTWLQQVNKSHFPSKIDQIGIKSSSDPGGKIYTFDYDPSVLGGVKNICIILTAIKDTQGSAQLVAAYFEIFLE